MNGTRDTDKVATTDNGDLDPQAAATLFARTRRQAQRQLQPSPPWLLVIRAVLVLLACGAVWFSVRGQHPYQHPTVADIPIVVGFGVANLIVTVGVARRATAGVRGRTRLRRGEVAVLVAAWVVVYLVMLMLAFGGANPAIVYGWYPITMPLIVSGVAWAIMMAVRAQWRPAGVGVAAAVTGAIGVVAGPVGAWAVAGVGLCLTLLGNAAALAWQRRA